MENEEKQKKKKKKKGEKKKLLRPGNNPLMGEREVKQNRKKEL